MNQREHELFESARLLPKGEARRNFLDTHCANDPLVRCAVEEFLNYEEGADRFFEASANALSLLTPTPESIFPDEFSLGDRIGRYRLQEKIGEGGFGKVYKAEQEEPIQRKVAVKVIKPGMDTQHVIARFEAERQALAMMDHPNIAKALDAGATENGRPYFVMELVRGTPITQFCEENKLTVKQRLKLFIQVCQAIQHAHQKGVIHRDVKPSNVLVTRRQGSGQIFKEDEPYPMVIDFGVAKAIDQRRMERTLFTNAAQMIGTPAYMSPEQAEMSKQDVDTRTDVYSLGILLYELLIATTPFPEERLREMGYAEIQKTISEEEPKPPSTVLNRLNGRFKTVAANRKCEPRTLTKLIKGDLDWIVIKAIDKDRNRRYATPLELAADLQRHLTNEPVTAKPPSQIYRLQKFTRRNQPLVLAGAIVAAAMLIGTTLAIWQAVLASHSEQRALASQADTEATLEFLRQDLLGYLDPFVLDPDRGPDRDIKLLSAIQLAAQTLDDRYQDRPLVAADVRLIIGNTLRRLGETESAEKHLLASQTLLEQELGEHHPRTLEAAQAVAWLLVEQSKLEKATALSQQILEVQLRAVGPDHEHTLEAMNCLAVCLLQGTRYGEALEIFEMVRKRSTGRTGRHQVIFLEALKGIQSVHYYQWDYKKWRALSHEIFDTSRRTLGPDHIMTLESAIEVINVLGRNSREADQLANETYERCHRVLGQDHPITIRLLAEIAFLTEAKGLNSLPIEEKIAEQARLALGPNHWNTWLAEMLLAVHYGREGMLQQAEQLFIDIMERVHGIEGTDTVAGGRVMRWLVGIYLRQGRFEEAENMRTTVLEASLRRLGKDVDHTFWQAWSLANIYARQGKWEKAAQLYNAYLPNFGLPNFTKTNEIPHTAGVLAAHLSGSSNQAITMAGLGLDRYSSTSNFDQVFALALPLLLISDSTPYLSTAIGMVQRNTDQTHPLEVDLLTGLAACRQGKWEVAEQIFSPYAATVGGPAKVVLPVSTRITLPFPQSLNALLATYYFALCQHKNGHVAEAQATLEIANHCLDKLLYSGDLGNSVTHAGQEWMPFATLFIAKKEADANIHGQPHPPQLDHAYLARARKQWQPVKSLLEQAEWAARNRNWAGARTLYLRAFAHDHFDWDAAAYQDTSLGLKVCSVMLLAGDIKFNEQLIPKLLDRIKGTPVGNPKPILLASKIQINQLHQDALILSRNTLKNRSGRDHGQWKELTLGMAELRNGNYVLALESLNRAQQAFNQNCSGTAHAYASITCKELGRDAEARSHAANAEAIFQRLLDNRQDDLGRDWHNTAVFELALNEMRLSVTETKP